MLWTYKGPDDESFQVGKCSRECGSCNHDCPLTQPEQCTAIYFEDTQRSCTAIYQCRLYEYTTQSTGPASYRVKLDVHYPPGKLTISDSHPIAIHGQPFELSCQTSDLGNPEANIIWQPDTDGVITQGRGSSTIRFERVDHQTMPRELKCYPAQDGGLVSEDVLQKLGDSAILEIYSPHVSTAPIVASGIQQNDSPKDHEVFTMGVIMSCAFGGLVFLCVVVITVWVYRKRKASPRTSQFQLQELGTSLSGDVNAPLQETSLPILLPEDSIQTLDTGLATDTDPTRSAVSFPVQVSSVHPCQQEPNFNPRLPIMVSLKTTTPQQRVGHLESAALRERKQTSPKVAATDTTPDRILHLHEETPPKDKPKAIKRCECESDFGSTDGATRPKAVANSRQREDVRRSVSLDESIPSEPHTLCSSLPDVVRCPLLEEMISGISTAEKGPETQREGPGEGMCEEKRSPSKCKEETGPKTGLAVSMETIVEDTALLVKKKPPLGNQRGKASLDAEALSLGGNKVATTIVQMIKKQLVVKGHFGLPYHTFSDLCLRLYCTGNNWKVLAGKLGHTVEDVVLIDSCSAQHGLLAAEVVLRHWQRTADQDGTTSCNLRNLQDFLTDMGRKDLVEMLKN
ncbi:uncharacterized protein LOC144912609 isoform X2 [Branchiostoma floridae x Branchiostoma belcheri]